MAFSVFQLLALACWLAVEMIFMPRVRVATPAIVAAWGGYLYWANF